MLPAPATKPPALSPPRSLLAPTQLARYVWIPSGLPWYRPGYTEAAPLRAFGFACLHGLVSQVWHETKCKDIKLAAVERRGDFSTRQHLHLQKRTAVAQQRELVPAPPRAPPRYPPSTTACPVPAPALPKKLCSGGQGSCY